MLVLVESLESRRLYSVSLITLEVNALHGEEADVRASVADWKKEAAANYKVLVADLKASNLLKADKAFLTAIVKESAATFKALTSDPSKYASLLNSEVSKLVSAGKSLAKKPGNAKLEAALAAALDNSASALSTFAGILIADAQARVNGLTNDLDALANSNSSDIQLGNDVFTIENELGYDQDLLTQQSSNLQDDESTIFANFES